MHFDTRPHRKHIVTGSVNAFNEDIPCRDGPCRGILKDENRNNVLSVLVCVHCLPETESSRMYGER